MQRVGTLPLVGQLTAPGGKLLPNEVEIDGQGDDGLLLGGMGTGEIGAIGGAAAFRTLIAGTGTMHGEIVAQTILPAA